MFSNWQQDKAVTNQIDEAQALADKLAGAKPHIRDSHVAAARFCAASYLAQGLNLHDMAQWKPAEVARFARSARTKVAALRKLREYSASDGLAVWMHTARAITEPRIASAARAIWRQLAAAGPNVDTMTEDLLQDAGLPLDQNREVPPGFRDET